MDPESDEVTKKVTTTRMDKKEVTVVKGKFSKRMNRETGMFSWTALAMPPAPNISIKMAVFPKMVIHRKMTKVGTRRTPRINCRMVRPKDTLAINMPTKGDQAIHQDQ
jgi:hypothetical protein